MNAIHDFCTWLNATPWSVSLREGDWSFPIIETIHIIGLAFSVGTIMWVDLRFLGLAMKHESAADVIEQLEPYAMVGFFIMFVSGALLFLSEPLKCYTTLAFRLKAVMLVLASVNILYFWRTDAHKHITEWSDETGIPWQGKLVGAASLILWFGIVIAGRWTAYL
jgi:hypothetical protein